MKSAPSRWVAATVITLPMLVASVLAGNPIPQVVGPPVPQAVVPGSAAFMLTVYGANFVQGATVNWNRQPRTTTFISARKLQAQILASDVASPTAGYITVTNPPPGGGMSSSSYGLVEVHTPTSTVVVEKPHVYLPGNTPYVLLLSDFNNDGILDMAVGDGSEIPVLLGRGDGTFHLSSDATKHYFGLAAIANGDFNNDGNEDLVFGANPFGPPTHLQVSLGKGNGKFTRGQRFGHYDEYPLGMAVGDFNGDGNLDLITVTAPDTLSVFLGQGDGSFRHSTSYNYVFARGTTYEVVPADLNGDGILDLVVLVGTDGLYVQLGKGDGAFTKPRRAIANDHDGCGFGPGVFVSDFNNDGKADLAYCEQDASTNKGKIWVALGNGDGTFQKPAAITVHPYQGVFSFAVGDFNSDGKTDLIANYITQINPIRAETDLLIGNGDGSFQPKKIISLPGEPFYNAENGIVPGDFNSDGLLDFISLAPGEVDVFMQK